MSEKKLYEDYAISTQDVEDYLALDGKSNTLNIVKLVSLIFFVIVLIIANILYKDKIPVVDNVFSLKKWHFVSVAFIVAFIFHFILLG